MEARVKLRAWALYLGLCVVGNIVAGLLWDLPHANLLDWRWWATAAAVALPAFAITQFIFRKECK
jgi:hypothetical protein